MLPGLIPPLLLRDRHGPTLTNQTAPSPSTANVAAGNTYTFSSVAIGAAAADRIVIVAAYIPGGGTISSMTIGGIAATKLGIGYSGVVYYALVPTGTTATIVATIGGATVNSCALDVWSLTGYSDPMPYDMEEISNISANTSSNGSIAVPPNGVVIGFLGRVGTGGVTWTNLTERSDRLVETNGGSSSADTTSAAGSAGLSVTATYGSSTFTTLLLVSWQ